MAGTAINPSPLTAVGTPIGGQSNGVGAPVSGVTPPPIVALPKTPTTPTAPTGVASSQLATDTTNAQATGTQNLTQAVTDHATTKANTPTFNPQVSVVDLLSSKGMPSDFASRAKLAQSAGITDYVGSTQQNQQLMGYINNPPVAPGSSTTSSTGAGGTSSTSGDTKSSTTTTTPVTTTPGDIYSPQLTQVQSDLASSLEDYNNKVGQILNGTFPLTQYQQSILTSTQNQFNELTQMQMLANKSYEGGVALAGNREGLNIQSPQEYLAVQNQAVSDGLVKISNLDSEATKTMATLQQGFMDKDYQIINDQYTKLQSTLEDKAKAIEDLQSRTDDLYKFTQDYQQKADEFAASQKQQNTEFNETQGLEMKKLALQYPDIDPNTGLLKAGSDPTTLTGVSTLPGTLGGHVFSIAEAKSLGATGADLSALTRAAQANGFGVVKETDQANFDKTQNSYTGLQGEFATGALNPNDNILSDIQSKPATSSILFRIFGATTPDAISSALGATTGAATLPSIANMTWQQASDYLSNSMYSMMGTQPGAQQATSAFNTANSIVNNGVSTSTVTNPIINTNAATSLPGLQ